MNKNVVTACLPKHNHVGEVLSADIETRARSVKEVARYLRKYRPRIALVFVGGRGGAAYQLPMWLPFIESVGERYIVITQLAENVEFLRQFTNAPVLAAPSAEATTIKRVFVPSIELAFYVRNTKENRPYIAQRHATHVFLNHGDSDKPANFNPLHRDFDKIFVCGQAGIERYARHGVKVPRAKFEIVGRPQIGKIEFQPDVTRQDRVARVLYAPTWQGLHEYDKYTSLPVGTSVVKKLIEHGAAVIFRPHPLSRKPAEIEQVNAVIDVLAADAAASGRAHVWGEQAEETWSVADCANQSDALISDVSSVVSDYLATGKPYALIAMDRSVQEFKDEFASATSGYVIDRDLVTIDEQLAAMLETDPLREQRLRQRDHVLGGLTGDEAAARFVVTATRLMPRLAVERLPVLKRMRRRLGQFKRWMTGQSKRVMKRLLRKRR